MPGEIAQIAPGLWRWTAPHPDWRPGGPAGSGDDWDQMVGSVLYTTPERAFFFDPLLPPEPEPFWAWADQRTRDKRVAVLTTLSFHRRSRHALVARYGASISRSKRNLPQEVQPLPLRRLGETMFWLPEHRALVPGDRLLGQEGGGLRLCPQSWLRYLGSGATRADLKQTLTPLLELPIAHVLVSHGEPVIGDGARALREALARA